MDAKIVSIGLAVINAIANLAGGGAISLVGLIKSATGTFSYSLLPIVALTLAGGIAVLMMTRPSRPPSDDGSRRVTPSRAAT